MHDSVSRIYNQAYAAPIENELLILAYIVRPIIRIVSLENPDTLFEMEMDLQQILSPTVPGSSLKMEGNGAEHIALIHDLTAKNNSVFIAYSELISSFDIAILTRTHIENIQYSPMTSGDVILSFDVDDSKRTLFAISATPRHILRTSY